MFLEKDFDTLNLSNENIEIGVRNIIRIADEVKEGVYDKAMSFFSVSPTYVF